MEFAAFLILLLVIALGIAPIAAVIMLAGLRGKLSRMNETQERVQRQVEQLSARVATVLAKRDAASAPLPAIEPVVETASVPDVVPSVPQTMAPKTGPDAQVVPPILAAPPVPPPRAPSARTPSPGASVHVSPDALSCGTVKQQREPSRFEVSVRSVLSEMWNWILVGEQHRPTGVSVEYAVASTWLLRVSIVVIVMGIGFFLKWSFDHGIIGPAGRVGMSILAGVAMLGGGIRLLRGKYRLIGQGLMGGGVVTLYFSMYAAGPREALLSTGVVFGMMMLITLAAGVVAVVTDSMLVAVLGVLGGYLTPVLLSTGVPNFPGLFSYMLLLSVGVLGIAQARQWRLPSYLAFLCTYLLFASSLKDYTTADFTVVMSFLAAFFVVHSSIAYVQCILKGAAATTLEIIHTVANGVLFAGFGYWLVVDAYGRPYPALLALGTATFYAAHVVGFLRRARIDRRLLITLIALSAVFTTWTLPLVMEKETLTISLSLLALMFLWLGGRMGSRFIENLGHLVYVAVFFRLAALDLPRNFGAPPGELDAATYWPAMGTRLWTFGVSIGSIVAAFWLQRRRLMFPAARPAVAPENDIPETIKPGVVQQCLYWGCVLFVFAFLYLEVGTMLLLCRPFRLPVLTVLWCGMALYFLWQFATRGRTSGVLFGAMVLVVLVAALKLLAMDLASWCFCDRGYYDLEYRFVDAGARLLDFGCLVALLCYVWWWMRSTASLALRPAAFGWSGLALAFLYATLEMNSLLHWRLPAFERGGLSVLWALFAFGFIGCGIWRSVTALRFLGLGLFAVVVGKVFLVDLDGMPMIYRVVAFIAVGVALLMGSFVYIHSSRKFQIGSGEENP